MSSEQQTADRNGAEQDDEVLALRWLLRGVVLMVLTAVLAWGGWMVLSPDNFPLRSVRIETPLVHVTQEEVRAVVLPYAAAGFLRIDMKGLQEKLQTLPWVYRASLRRAWPDVLEVSIKEQLPVARWEAGGLVNEHGELFKPDEDGEQPQLPLFVGPQETAPAIVARHQEFLQQLSSLQLMVHRIVLSERRAWEVELSNGLKVALGRDDVVMRMQRLVKVYPQILAPRLDVIERVDLRYTNGFAVRWRSGQVPTV